MAEEREKPSRRPAPAEDTWRPRSRAAAKKPYGLIVSRTFTHHTFDAVQKKLVEHARTYRWKQWYTNKKAREQANAALKKAGYDLEEIAR